MEFAADAGERGHNRGSAGFVGAAAGSAEGAGGASGAGTPAPLAAGGGSFSGPFTPQEDNSPTQAAAATNATAIWRILTMN
jgi:hypothetical protein